MKSDSLYDTLAERSVLGAILVRNEALDDIADVLEPEHFRRESHVSLYRVMRIVHMAGKPVDLVTVMAGLQAEGVTDISAADVAGLTDGMPRSANVVAYAATVREK